jgi:hypothetical protein
MELSDIAPGAPEIVIRRPVTPLRAFAVLVRFELTTQKNVPAVAGLIGIVVAVATLWEPHRAFLAATGGGPVFGAVAAALLGASMITSELVNRRMGFLLAGYSTEGSWGSAWEVLMSSDRNLSVQLHVYGETAEPMVADGLGFSVVQWRPGDIFIQFVSAEITLGLNGRFLETSLYDLDSGERLDFENGVSEVHVLADE